MTAPLLLPVLTSSDTAGWPKYSNATRIGYVDAAEAFARPWLSDAHFAAYSVPSVEHRLTLDAIGRLPHGWPMVLLVVDVDHAWKKEKPTTPEAIEAKRQRIGAWWAGELHKLVALAVVHPGAFVHRSRSGGYRIIFRLAAPFVIWTVDDKEAWRERYRRELLYLARRFAIVGDPACADITRLYRLPFVVVDGTPTSPEPSGDPAALGVWTHEPSDDERDHDVSTARLLASKERIWVPVLRALAPERGGQNGQEPAPELRPEDQDEERVFKRAAAYLGRMSPSIEGAGGDAALWDAALAMVRGFNLGPTTALAMLLRDFNPRCTPPWPRAAIERKCREAAARSTKPWGYLRDAEGGEKGLHNKPSERRSNPREAYREAKARKQQPSSDAGAPMAEPEQEHVDDQEAEARPDWRSELQQDRNGYRKNLANVSRILANDPGWEGCLAFNEFAGRLTLLKCPPSHVDVKGERWPRPWRDADDTLTAIWLQNEWRIEAGPELVAHAVVAVAFKNKRHPVREYLEGLRWDGVPRLARWLTTYLGVRETDYSRAVGAFMLRAAVARIFSPGCKVDTMLVLQGEQGAFKSTAIKTLCGAQWFTDDLADFGSKDAAMQLRGAWFIEAAELSGMGRAEVERIKAFFSRSVERYRTAYGRHVEDQPRQCVFFGTTNADTYLKDETGNRRFWPVLCGVAGSIDIAGLAQDRDQLWAEAVHDIQAGERWHLDKQQDAKALKQAQAAQEAVRERDAWETRVQRHLEEHTPMFATTAELLGDAIGLDAGRWGVSEQRRIGAIMRGLGWQRRQHGTGVGKEWGFVPPYLAPREEAPMPKGGQADEGGIGAFGYRSTAQKGSGTDGTDRTDGFHDQTATKGEPEGGVSPSPSHWQDSQNIGSIGAIGASSQKQQVRQAPIGTDRASSGTDGASSGTDASPTSDPTPTPPPVSGVSSGDPPVALAAGAEDEEWERLE